MAGDWIPWWKRLRDPRWQKKRLEIMQRAEFACTMCGDEESTLNVHHGYYEQGFDPWAYPNETLWCLCEDCHRSTQEVLRDLHYQIAKTPPEFLQNIMSGIIDSQRDVETIIKAIAGR